MKNQQLIAQLSDDKFAKPQLDKATEQANENENRASLSEMIKTALAQPMFYPPLHESVFAGDQIAIAVQSNLPHARQVLECVLAELNAANVAATDIVVVISPRTARQLGIDSKLYESTDEQKTNGERPGVFEVEFEFNSINFQVHDPEIATGLSYVVGNEAGEPLHLNRLLVDADVILPIACPTAGEADQQIDCIHPEFSSEVIKSRYADRKGSFLSRWEEIELVNDTLGAFFSIQLVCGPGDEIRNVFCGVRKDATNAARSTTNDLWAFQWEGESDVTVATIEMNEADQTWDDFARALITASRLSTPDAPIVVCSEISVAPDRNIRKALLSQFESGISGKLSKTMQHVAAIVNERPVFLKSNLKRNPIEELGLGFIETIDEINRIAQPHNQGLLIRDAHLCQVNRESDTNNNPNDQEVCEDA